MSSTLLEDLTAVSYPTIGHFLEDGFVSPTIQSLLANVKIAGPAVTVRIADHDAIAMNRALLALQPGDVLVVDMCGDHQHAPVGAVTAAAALAQGAAAVVVDGVATDVLELRQTGLPVFARGTSCLTTKRLYGTGSAVNVPVLVGGVEVNPGDLVLGDDNGLIVLAPEAARNILGKALASDAAEPAILARIASGEPLQSILAV
ncbi:regulator of RNase E activity RraA [Arthrobacter sp. 1088]|uniref:RraA family protein n=1 Tax=Arthrobacter sp. 1088 TaxID=2817768 RepID=UPI0028561FD0|nr:RraA family protein [Arthrobacter sp. 1088]MDR6688482.1 regulator of RNase E activity RraA [Arthrobacter sp. 1088]